MKIIIESSMKHLVLDANPEILQILEKAQVISSCYQDDTCTRVIEQGLKIEMKLISDAEFAEIPLINKELKNDV